MKIKTSDLTLLALNWTVVRCECDIPAAFKSIPALLNGTVRVFRGDTSNYSGPVSPSTNWAHGGPIIEREGITTSPHSTHNGVIREWKAGRDWPMSHSPYHFGTTPLIAAMRCYVASKLGDTVDIPEGLR
jgi:hypothetical protein